jgi:hypothetical protein
MFLGGSWLFGCTNSSTGQPPTCQSPSKPAFNIRIRTPEGMVLPAATKLHVTFGSGAETFNLEKPAALTKSIFCHLVPTGADPDGGAVDADNMTPQQSENTIEIQCELWTNGAADVEISSPGFVDLRQMLEAKTDDCGIITTHQTFELRLPEMDGGSEN